MEWYQFTHCTYHLPVLVYGVAKESQISLTMSSNFMSL